jgi:hypothetical protein
VAPYVLFVLEVPPRRPLRQPRAVFPRRRPRTPSRSD